FSFNHTSTPEIYTLSLHDALPIFYPDNALFPNIEFEDGTRWGVNSIKDIFNMDGRVLKAGTEDSDSTKSKAILRITIDKSGKVRSEEHTSELQSRENLVCRLLLEK